MKTRIIITTAIALFISASSSCAPLINAQVVISGKMVSSTDGAPVKGALVSVEGIVDVDEVGTHDYVRTDENGRFAAKAWGIVVLRAWKTGYAMRDIQVGNASDLVGHEISIELRKLQSSNLAPVAINREGMSINDGFSFSSGKVVGADSSEADIKISAGKAGTERFLEAVGDGGVCFQAFSSGSDFYNTPEAPQEGYSNKTQIVSASPGIFYRTRDGKRYAKVRLIRGVKQTASGEDHSAYWLQWAYQPDGTRNLEIAVSSEYGFPFEKFGLTPESLR
jgi:hypothetical protein